MSRLIVACGVVIGIACASLGDAEEAKDRWFDYEHCALCSQWSLEPDLINHVSDSQHPISDGMMWVTSVDSGYLPKLARVMSAEDSVIALLDAGADLPLCRFCLGIGELTANAVRFETVMSPQAMVLLFTTTDSAMVGKVQDFGRQAISELPAANARFRAKHHPAK